MRCHFSLALCIVLKGSFFTLIIPHLEVIAIIKMMKVSPGGAIRKLEILFKMLLWLGIYF